MRKLQYQLDLKRFREIKGEIVPAVFTEHQFCLIEKKFSGKKMSASEKNEFSRTVSRKMNAISRIAGKENEFFAYGGKKMIQKRVEKAKKYVKKFARQFKNKHVIIGGSFLHSRKFNDIDIFVVSKYNKDDFNDGKFHINYISEDDFGSLFFRSLSKICISNRKIDFYPLNEKINLDTLIALYQEVFSDLGRKFRGIRKTLRDFLLQAFFIGNRSILDSQGLKIMSDSIMKHKKPEEIIKNIFVNAVVLGVERKKAVKAMKKMVSSYKSVMKEYPQHKKHYLNITEAFERVLSIET